MDGDNVDGALRYDRRPSDNTPIHTQDLPMTPVRDRNILATAWIEAPPELLQLGHDLDRIPVAEYKRRIGPWILWRAGPATQADARYWVCHIDDFKQQFVFRLFADSSGAGQGPSGLVHERFRAWKEDLRDHHSDPASS